jgi:hypothetical protein
LCGLNDGGGCFNLGLMYEKGKGVKQDDFKALPPILHWQWLAINLLVSTSLAHLELNLLSQLS